MSIKIAVVVGAMMCAASIAGGAFGAHALEQRLAPDRLVLWLTAARYLMYAGFGVMACGLAAHAAGLAKSPGATALAVGGLIFAGTVAALALGGPKFLGAVTPVGGLLLMLGFVQLAWSAWNSF